MRIVNREEFLAMPAGTIYMEYDGSFGNLCVKGDSLSVDFYSNSVTCEVDCDSSGELADILHEAENNSSYSIPLHFNTECRDGLFEEKQLFAVYEERDTTGLIARLEETLS